MTEPASILGQSDGEQAKLRDVTEERVRRLRKTLTAQFHDKCVSPSDFKVPGKPWLTFPYETSHQEMAAAYDCLPLDLGDPRMIQALIDGCVAQESVASAQDESNPDYRMALAETGDPSKDVRLYVPSHEEPNYQGPPSDNWTLSRVKILRFEKDVKKGAPKPKLAFVHDNKALKTDPKDLVALIPKSAVKT